jgi:hypothetical protein
LVLVEESDFEQLRREATQAARDVEKLPLLPGPDKEAFYPAADYLRASLARELLVRRKRLGLTQEQLAHLAGIPVKILIAAGSGQHPARPRTLGRIVDALEAEERKQSRN